MFEFIKENKKIIYVIIITIVLFILISKFITSCSYSVVDYMMEETDTNEIPKILSLNVESEEQEILKGIAIKNGKWETYPLSKDFLKKYNCKEGIFSEYNFEEVYGHKLKEEYNKELYNIGKEQINNNETFKNYKLGGVFYYHIGNALNYWWVNSTRSLTIAYYLNNKNELYDFYVIKNEPGLDEYGDLIRDYDKEFTYKNLNIITHILFFDHNWHWYAQALDPIDIKKEPCSEKLVKKVLNKNLINVNGLSQHNEYVYGGNMYIDFFPDIEYSFGRFYYDKGVNIEQSIKNKKFYAVCQLYDDDADPVYSDDLPKKNYLYKVQFELNDENKLDDIWVEYVDEISNEELDEKYD